MISVVVAARDEAAGVGPVLQRALAADDVEVLLVDGGSHDETMEVAAGLGVRVLRSRPGRGPQMNTGAAAARGEALVFLHADTLLAPGYDTAVAEVLARPGIAGGAFRLGFDDRARALRVIQCAANVRARRFRLPYGDQGLFVRRETFDAVGGFPDQPILEDFEFVRRLNRRGRIEIVPPAVSTSARRFRRLGPWRTCVLNQCYLLAYLSGVAPARIADWYERRTG